MKRRQHIGLIALVCVTTLLGCSRNKDATNTNETDDDGADSGDARIEAATSSNAADVTVMTLKPTMFAYDIVSNGKASAGAYVDMTFNAGSTAIQTINVKNGQHVAKGQIIAELDCFKLKNAVANAHTSLERAKIDLADALIGQGYDPDKPDAIPADVMSLARLRSGVAQAEIQLSEDERALSDATLRAPFDGTIGNLFQKAGNLPDSSKPFCRVIASSGMEVEFQILESELLLIHNGDAVEVTPYTSDATYHGVVKSINPVVETTGLVKICATINGSSALFDGMNVRVSVKRNIQQALVVPKSAVLQRSGGKQVVFTNENDKAIWHYVTTSLENMNEYVVTDGLSEGDEVIISGNLNLAHEAPVNVIRTDG